MNNNWRRQKGEIHHQGTQGTRSYSRKPSLATWQPTVPSWEKKFCTLVGSVPWWKLLETKRFMYLYDNVVQWNDSAGEEAFHNAKNRFWAEINGLPCDISLPDPDSYIDKIDWDSEIDPELLLDLEREPKVPDEKDKSENVVILGNSLLLNQPFVCGGGWGDAEEGAVKENNTSSNWKNKDYENSWEPYNSNMKDTGYGNCWNNSWEWNQRENNYNGWDNNESSYVDYRRKREGADLSRYKTTRFHNDNRQNNRGWRNPRGRQRTDFAYEQPTVDPTQWNSVNYCGWAN
ncbi:hypothetical protein HRI_004854100 [Hibiscus trionum]|uniref:Uncharacterized protein n=1 Tax=Hibiscus trionum TaxID=183268 RepID=A0A9W7JHS5_HIBTR|nr:hypothetical protein HRI_004854100 [Hibiscus trionum]